MQIDLISGANPGPYTGAGNNTYVVTGAVPVLIDAATGRAAHLDGVARVLGERPLGHVLVTHAHSDHAGGSVAVQERWPGAVFHKMPWPERDGEYPVEWHALADGDRLPAGDDELEVVHTPGHAPDHVCLFHEPTRTVFCGDLVIQDQTVVIPASLGGSLVRYLESLTRVQALRPRRVLPAHGREVDDFDALVASYRAHRLRREEEILGALEASPRTPEQLVSQIYRNLSEALRHPASESVRAHLDKLEAEGRVRPDGDAWRLNV